MSPSWNACCRAPASRPTPSASSATVRPASSITSTPITPTPIDRGGNHDWRSRRAALVPLLPTPLLPRLHRPPYHGLYHIRGYAAKRRLPPFDDLVFLGASVSRYPLEGYREKCATDVTLGTRFAKKPIHLKIPITIAGMSFGALGANAKEAIGQAATAMGTSTTTGDGGMTQEERQSSKTLVYQVLPSRYGLNPDDLRRADAIEV